MSVDKGKVVNIHQAKTHLSRLIEEVITTGQKVTIAKAGRPVALLSAHPDAAPKRRMLGILRGEVTLPTDLDALNPEIESMFEAKR